MLDQSLAASFFHHKVHIKNHHFLYNFLDVLLQQIINLIFLKLYLLVLVFLQIKKILNLKELLNIPD